MAAVNTALVPVRTAVLGLEEVSRRTGVNIILTANR